MKLKEAFRYSNYLKEILASAYVQLKNYSGWYMCEQKHLKRKVNPDAEDVLKTDAEIKNGAECYDVNKLVELVSKCSDEYEKLCLAIDIAKASVVPKIDATLAANQEQRKVIEALQPLTRVKDKKKTYKATDYKFNAEGNQISYSYDVEETATVAFDVKAVKDYVKSLKVKTDAHSTEIEGVLLETEVALDPEFDITDSIEDVLSQCLKTA